MTVKALVIGAAGVAAIGAAAAGLTPVVAFTTAAQPAQAQVRHIVFGAPLPLEPAPEQPVSAGAPLPTPDEVSGMLTRLTDAGIGYKEKGDLVENGIEQQDGHALDSDLRRAYRDGELPYTFNVLSVSPTTPGHAIAPVAISGPKMTSHTIPLTLVDQGSWVLSQDSAQALLHTLSGQPPALPVPPELPAPAVS